MTTVEESLLLPTLSPVEYKDRGKISNSKSSFLEDAKFYRGINAPSYISVHLHQNIADFFLPPIVIFYSTLT